MRVLILVPGLPVDLSKIKGGVHSAVSNLLKGFAFQDIDVRVLSIGTSTKKDISIALTNRIEICYAYEGPLPYHSMNYLLNSPRKVLQHINEFQPDIIHFQEGNSFLLTRIKGLHKTKYLQTIHGMSFFEAKRKKKIKDKLTWYFNGALQMWLMPKNIIHLSQFSVDLYHKKKATNGTIIPNAIIPAYFEIPLKTHTSNELLYVGLIDNNKNLIFLLNAMARLVKSGKPFTLNVLGDFQLDSYRKLITDFVRENDLAEYVHFRGWVSQEVVMQYLAQSDILVVSSKHESLPMVIAEAMAAGKVVAASAVGGIPEMIDHNKNGFLFHLDKPDELVSILESLYNNNDRLTQLSLKAREVAQRYDCRNVAERTIEFYTKCI